MAIKRNKVLKKARKQLRKRNWSKALREYEKLVDDDPEDMRSLLKCADLYSKTDRPQKALQSYKTVADTYAQQEMYEKAIAVYKQAQRLTPDDVVLQHAIGECYYRLGRLKDAVRTFHQVQEMYGERGDHDRQREILEHMVRIDPEDVGLRIQLAERYTKDGFTDAALQSFQYCAEILDEEGRLDELLQVLERILYLTPEEYEIRKRVVRIYLDRQDNEAALKHLQICFRELSDDVETLELLAQTFERLERNEKAVMVLEELAPLYESADRQSDAQNLYRRLLRLDPDNEMARKALGDDSGPDSGILAGGANPTASIEQRQHTPAPTSDALDDVEFLDDDIEVLDDDLDLVTESAPANSTAPAPPSQPPEASAPPSQPDTPSEPPQGPPGPPPSPPPPAVDDTDETTDITDEVDLTDEIEFVDDAPPDLTDEIELVDDDSDDSDQSTEPVEDVEPIDDVEPIEEVDPVDDGSEDAIRQMLGECDVFLKYGLYDKAAEAIDTALQQSPDSVYAHEQLLKLHDTTGNAEDACNTLLRLAELHADDEAKVYDYLQRARELAPEPLVVDLKAKALDVDLDGAPPVEEVDDIAIEPVDDAQPETLHMDAAPLEDEASSQAGDSAPEQDSEASLVDDALEGIDDALDSLDMDSMVEEASSEFGFNTASSEPSSESESIAPGPDSDEEILEFDTDAALDFDTDAEFDELEALDDFDDGHSLESDSEIVADDDLRFDDADDLVEMDLVDDDADIDDADFESLDDTSEAESGEEGPDVNSLFSDVETDELFDDLFDTGEADDGAVNLGDDDPDGEMAEIDFFIQQGLAEEASEALAKFEEKNPDHPGVDTRREQLQQIRSGVPPAQNPFGGARSLSQKFNPSSLEEPTVTDDDDVIDMNSVANSNLELGIAYRDMGLLEEAIDEFEVAIDDPEAAASAFYNIGLCRMELGDYGSAEEAFRQILDIDEVTSELRSNVRDKLSELEAQAS